MNEEIKKNVWNKGQIVQNNNQEIWRKDQCDAWIKYNEYGNRNSDYGWEIDHIDCNTDNNSLSNLRPLQWKNNLDKSDGKLKCKIISKDIRNIEVGNND